MEPCDLLCPGQVSRPCRACLRRHRPPGNWGGTAGGASGLPSREDGRFYVFGDRGGRDMIVVMGPGHTRPQLDAVIAKIEEAGLRGQISEGVERIVVGVVGDSHSKELLRERIEAMPGVENVVRILQPYKLVSREFHGGGDSTVWVRDVAIGGGRVVVIAGPCSVESREQVLRTAQAVKSAGAQLLRGGAFKPRTSPYSF